MKKNNKGSAFVMVLVILAIVGLLAAVALWVSLVNYQMKLTDIKVKNNFYSAESVLDQICVGLQTDVSDSYKVAYGQVIANYSAMTEEQRKNLFEAQYKRNLKGLLKATGDPTEMAYSLGHLKSYVYSPLLDETTLPYADVKVVSSFQASNGVDGRMDTFDTNIVLKGLEVTYTDDEGFTSIIQTDISLNVPEMKFVTAASMPDTFGFSLVGTTGIIISGSDSVISGSVYAGKTGNADNVSLDLNCNVTFSNLQYLISNGTTKVNMSRTFNMPSGSQFWTQNILVDSSAKANLFGETYVADDLTMKGNSPKVTLGTTIGGGDVSGKYIGFGTSKTLASESSAIILNGTNSLLDMSHLKELILGGYSYVNTSGIDNKDITLPKNNDVATGESIAIKGGQIAYLIPPECIAVQATGGSAYNSNPITYAEYRKMKEDSTAYTEVDPNVVSKKTGKALKDYLTKGQTIEDVYSKVFVPSGDDDGLVYYYVNLSPERAATYYTDYNSNADLGKLDLYTDFYTDKIQVKTDSSSIYTAGNYTMYNGDNATLVNTPSVGIVDAVNEYKDNFEALVYILTPNRDLLTTEALSKNIFENLIHETNLTSVVSSGGKTEIDYIDPLNASKNMKAIIIDGDYTYDSSVETGQQVALIISTGNVTVNKNYCGTIIAKGNININNVAKIDERNDEEMKKLLATVIPGTSDMAVYNLFNDGANYMIGSSPGSSSGNMGAIPYSDIITYQNWIMK